jgi:hypothetical protein
MLTSSTLNRNNFKADFLSLDEQPKNKSASVYSVFDEGKIALSKFRSSEPVRKSLNL